MEGGYPLHLDATCEKGLGGLFVIMDGWRGWVLAAKRIPTEHQDHLQPLVEHTLALFGDPVAVIRDLGEGMGAAVEPLRQRGIPDLFCHYHFLGAVGTRVLEKPYSLLREVLRKRGLRSKLRSLLRELRRKGRDDDFSDQDESAVVADSVRENLLATVLWILEGKGNKDAPFPFGLPHWNFLRRCERGLEQAELWVPSPRTTAEARALRRLRSLLTPLAKDRDIRVANERLDKGWLAFCELRDVLRLTSSEMPGGDNHCDQPNLPSQELLRFAEIEKKLLGYKNELLQRVEAEDKSSAHAIVLSYLQNHGEHLFGHPARRDDQGRITVVVARTNMLLERWFGRGKKGLRHRLGRAHLARDLQQQPAQASLVQNLRHPDYVRVLCGSIDNLPDALAGLEGVDVAGTAPLVRAHRDQRLHRRIKQLLEDFHANGKLECHEPQDPVASAVPSSPSPSLDEFRGVTEEQMRTRCTTVFAPEHDPRLPPPGEVITRTWKGVEHQVLILDRGFGYKGRTYTSLSSIAYSITEGRVSNGVSFFRLNRSAEPEKSPAKPTYRLGPLDQLIRSTLAQAGYNPSTVRVYIGHIQRFAKFHMRSPEVMGKPEIVQFLLYLVDEQDVSLGTYRAVRTALSALYRFTLQRPEEVEEIPRRPDPLRSQSSLTDLNPSTTQAFMPAVASEEISPSPTVS